MAPISRGEITKQYFNGGQAINLLSMFDPFQNLGIAYQILFDTANCCIFAAFIWY